MPHYYFIATEESKLANLFWAMDIGNEEPDFFGEVNRLGIIGYDQDTRSFKEIQTTEDLSSHQVFLIFDCLCEENTEFPGKFSQMKTFFNNEENRKNSHLLKHSGTNHSIQKLFDVNHIKDGSHINSPEYVYPEILQIFIDGEDVENKIDEYLMSLDD